MFPFCPLHDFQSSFIIPPVITTMPIVLLFVVGSAQGHISQGWLDVVFFVVLLAYNLASQQLFNNFNILYFIMFGSNMTLVLFFIIFGEFLSVDLLLANCMS